MADREINLKFTSDTKKAKKGAKEVKKSVDDIGKSKGIKEVNKDLDQTKKKGKEAADAVKRIPKGKKAASGSNPPNPPKNPDEEDFKRNMKQMSSEVRGLWREYGELSDGIGENIALLRKEHDALDANSESFQKDSKAIMGLISSALSLQKNVEKTLPLLLNIPGNLTN